MLKDVHKKNNKDRPKKKKKKKTDKRGKHFIRWIKKKYESALERNYRYYFKILIKIQSDIFYEEKERKSEVKSTLNKIKRTKMQA